MYFVRTFKLYRQNRRLRQQVSAFRAEIDTHVRVFRLDPQLPEILDLKARAPKIFASPMEAELSHLYFLWLNPYRDILLHPDGKLTIHERMLGGLFMPWSLAEFHLGKQMVHSECRRIVVDGAGTHLYDESDFEWVCYEAGQLNPRRANDPGNRVNNAARFVHHFTGLPTTMEELWPAYKAEFVLRDDGTWDSTLTMDHSPV